MAQKGFLYLEVGQQNTLFHSYTNATGATVDSKWADAKAGSFTDDDSVVHLTRGGNFWDDCYIVNDVVEGPAIIGTDPDDTFGSLTADDYAELELGSMSTQARNAVNITGGSITGITDLTVADGGTGASTFTDAGVLIGNGTGAIQVTSAGTAGQVLTSNGAGVDPTFQAAAGGGDILKFSATGIDGTVAGSGTIFTPSSNFVILDIVIVDTALTSATVSPAIGIGWTGPTYSDFKTVGDERDLAYAKYYNTASGNIEALVPSGSPLKWCIASGDEGTATVLTISIHVIGFYL
jgi:hypothetical protein